MRIEKNTTPYKRVVTALKGEASDKVPFTTYELFLPRCSFERDMRNRGICIVKRINSYKIVIKNVDIKSYNFTDEKGRRLVKTIYSTPQGELSTLAEPIHNTTWTHEYLFKSPDDYKAILFMIQNSEVIPDYEAAKNTIKELGEDFIVRDNFPLEPLQSLISSTYMNAENFSYEWYDNRDEIMKLYDAFVALNRKIYPIVANGPMEIVNYGGNVVPQIIGREGFEKYYLPHYDEAAEILHKRGKLLGCHFDGDNTPIMDLIAQTHLDYIEAYDPCISPGLKEARMAFKDKIIWINWPSAWHLSPPDTLPDLTFGLINDAGKKEGFIIGITEDIPMDCWKNVFLGIMDGIDKHAGVALEK